MSMHSFALKAALVLFEKAEPRFKAMLAEHGVTDPRELPKGVVAEILRKVMIQTTALHAPGADINAIDRVFRAFAHPQFAPAYERAKFQAHAEHDAFAQAVGPDCAVVMAALGLPVAPFDMRTLRLLASLSDDIDVVADQFARAKTAYVGYSSSAAPFYLLMTDCVRTMRQRVFSDDRLGGIRLLVERNNQRLPPDEGASFQRGCILFARESGDTIASTALIDRSPNYGSIILYAGWLEGAEPRGAPNNGCVPVPVQLLRGVLASPRVACWMARPVGSRPLRMN